MIQKKYQSFQNRDGRAWDHIIVCMHYSNYQVGPFKFRLFVRTPHNNAGK